VDDWLNNLLMAYGHGLHYLDSVVVLDSDIVASESIGAYVGGYGITLSLRRCDSCSTRHSLIPRTLRRPFACVMCTKQNLPAGI